MNAATLRILIEKGLSAEDILAVAEAMERKADSTNAERQARYRENRKAKKENVTRYSNGVTPPIDNNHTPSVSPNGETQKASAFPKPDWADVSVWVDFLANRKRKRLPNTATAHKAFLADIARLTDPDWPPGRLLEHATAKGWGAIYDPRQQTKPNGTPDVQPSNDQGPRNPYVRAVIANQAARSADERGQSGSWPEHGETAF